MTEKIKAIETKKKPLELGVAIVFCLFLYGWFCFIVRFGMGRPDEAFYLTIPQRMLYGDRLFVDEWHLSQLTALFQYIPYVLFVKITGGTEGIILYMRYVYLGISFLTYWYIIFKLRKNIIQAVVCAVLFGGFVPFAIFAPSYYNLPLFFMLGVCFILTEEDKKFRSFHLFLAGCLISGSVLMTPGLVLFYVGYCILVLIRFCAKKNNNSLLSDYDFVLDIRIWFGLLKGILFCAGLFILYMHITSGLLNIFKNLPNLFTDSEYDISADGNVLTFFIRKLETFIDQFHPLLLFIFICLLFSALYYKKHHESIKHRIKLRFLLFVSSDVVFILLVISSILSKFEKIGSWNYWLYHADLYYPLCILTFITVFLTHTSCKKEMVFLIVGLSLAVFKDIFSDVSWGIGCVIAVFPFVKIHSNLIVELQNDMNVFHKKEKSKSKKREKYRSKNNFAFRIKFLKVFSWIFTVFFTIWSLFNIISQCAYPFCEKNNKEQIEPIDYKEAIQNGPYKGIFTSSSIKNVYEASLCDLDQMKRVSDGPFFISMMAPYGYLYLDQPCSGYSSWLVFDDIIKRQVLYWNIYPDKRPAAIYIPRFSYNFDYKDYGKTIFESIKPYISFHFIECDVGNIAIIDSWK